MAVDTGKLGFPDAKSTGVPEGTALKNYNGPMTITTPGAVIDGFMINGPIRVTADNVTIKNSVIKYSSVWGIDAEGADGIRIENCDIVGPGYSGDSNAGILGSGTFIGNDISKSENGIVLTGGSSTVKGNFIHDLQDSAADPHYDGISVQGSQHGVLIENNTVLARDTSDIFIKNDFGPISDVTVNHNYLGGDPGYNVYVDARASGGPITGVKITNNYIDKGFYGDFSIDKSSPVVSGNTEYDPANPTPAPTPTPETPPSGTGQTPVPTTPLPATPVQTPSAGAAAPTTATLGSGSDALVLKISQDAYQGDAHYTVSVDGKQIGGTLTAHASHAAKQSDTLTVKGNWGVGDHDVAVNFTNDLWNGTSSTDRNLYVDSATYNGKAVANSKLALTSSGAEHLTVQDATAIKASTPAAAGATTADQLVLKVSQDAYKGDAQYTISVDGKQIGGTRTADASHAAGQSDTVTVSGNWAGGDHKLSINYLNDRWDGTAATDRNLHLDSATYNGKAVAGSKLVFADAGPDQIIFHDAGAAATSAPSTSSKVVSASSLAALGSPAGDAAMASAIPAAGEGAGDASAHHAFGDADGSHVTGHLPVHHYVM